MTSKHIRAAVLENSLIAKCTYQMKLQVPCASLEFFRPGQFAHIRIPGSAELLLRRPISINNFSANEGWIQLAYLAAGKGTHRLSCAQPGDELDILFPLGNGFKLDAGHKKVLLVGGGIGIAPLLSVITYYPDREYAALLGYRSRDCVYQEEEFEKKAETIVSTDDGTFGRGGFCTDPLPGMLESFRPDVILACGPTFFFSTLKRLTKDIGIPVYASLEQHMGCGTGGCSVCVCKIAGEHRRVCVEGPVFKLAEVEL